jgi:hypothetical protein
MVKMIPHRIIPESLAKDPVIELLSKHKLFDFDAPSNIVQIACELHYVISKRFADDPALLTKHGLFDFETEKNTVYLPIDLGVAKTLGVSPHSSEPLDSYTNGIGDMLKHIRNSRARAFASAQGGDKDALRELEQLSAPFKQRSWRY